MISIIRLSILESIRRQVHLITLFLGVILLIIPSLVNAFNMGAPERVVKDIGLTLVGYYGVALMLFLSSAAIPTEIERHTIFPLMARPMSRLDFVIAKFLSVSIIVAVSLVLLGTCVLGAMATFLKEVDWRIYMVIGEYLLEDMVLGAACIFFSTIASPVLAAVLGVFIYMVGGLPQTFIDFFLKTESSQVTARLTQFFKLFMPHFEFFQIKDAVAHNDVIQPGFLVATVPYALGWIALYLVLAGLSFERKDL